MLKIKNLRACIKGKEEPLLKGLDLHIKPGEIHAVMGPNGAGKSALAKTLAGHPDYQAEGEAVYTVHFKNKNLLSLSPEERALEGVFMAFQYPVEVPGLSNLHFLRAAFNGLCRHHGTKEMEEKEFQDFALKKAERIGIGKDFLLRNLNENFSGGEKKQNEVLQLLVFSPRLAILDETDSGLDVDSIQKIAKGVQSFHDKDRSLLLITHYHRMLQLIRPDFVHILIDGRIRESGGFELAEKTDKEGYDRFMDKP